MSTLTQARTDLGTRRKVHSFERFLNHHTDSLTRRFGPADAAVMRREMLEEYRALIPQLPDIGGRRNPWNANLAGAPMALAVYRVVLRHGGSAQDAGEVVRVYAQQMVERIPRRLRPLLLRPRPARAQKVERWTQQRRYPEDWVCQFVDGAGQDFDSAWTSPSAPSSSTCTPRAPTSSHPGCATSTTSWPKPLDTG